MQNNYDAAMRDAATNANITATGQKVLDAIMGNKIEAMQNRINNARNDVDQAIRQVEGILSSLRLESEL